MKVCDSICDFCTHYAFNPDAEGAYTGNGMCQHPDHTGRKEPYDGCTDFSCLNCAEEEHPNP